MCLNDVTAVRRTVEDDFKHVKTSRERWQVLQDRVKQVTSKVGICISVLCNGINLNPNLKCQCRTFFITKLIQHAIQKHLLNTNLFAKMAYNLVDLFHAAG